MDVLIQDGLPAFIRTLLDDINRLIGPVFLVGGAVRHSLQGTPPSNELTLLVSRPLAECQQRLQEGGHGTVTLGVKHNSLHLPLKGWERPKTIKICTFRHRPNHPATVEEDLLHRDLSINAMAFQWPSGPLFDPFQGQLDLTLGRIRMVNGKDTLSEDPLRALIFFRFTLELAGIPNPEDLQRSMETSPSAIPPERWRTEMDRIFSLPLSEEHSNVFFRQLFSSPLGSRIFVEMAATDLLDKEKLLGQKVRKQAAEMVLQMTSPPPEEEVPLLDLRWTALFWVIRNLKQTGSEKGAGGGASRRDESLQMVETVLQKFRFSNRRQRRILQLLQQPDINLAPTDRSLMRLLQDQVSINALFRLVHAREKARQALSPQSSRQLEKQLYQVIERCRTILEASRRPDLADLVLSGGEILDLVRQPPGPWMGELIAWLVDWINTYPGDNKPVVLQQKIQEWIANQKQF